MMVFIKAASFLLLLCVYCNAEDGQHKYNRRTLTTVKVMNASNNQVQMNVVNENYKQYLSTEDNFLSATLEITLSPIKYAINEAQKDILQKGMTKFLKSAILTQTEHDVSILAASVMKSRGFSILDSDDDKPSNMGDTLEILTVVSAQQHDSGKKINTKEFGEIVVNLCKIYKDVLIDEIKQRENDSLIQESVNVQTQIFNNLAHVNIALHEEKKTSGLTLIGKVILGCFIGLLTIIIATRLYSRLPKR